MSIGMQKQVEKAIARFSTPFKSQLTAEQETQFSIDPQNGLTRRRLIWYSNDSLFDKSLFSEVESGIRLETTASGSDEARIKSSISGQYLAQSLAVPGVGLVVDDSNTSLDDNNHNSLSHGEVYAGAFWWDDANDQVDTGVGYKWDSSGWYFFVKSLGDHLGDSPVAQSDFSKDKLDGGGESGQVVDIGEGFVANFPYTWYNQGPFEAAVLDKQTNELEETNRVGVYGRSSIATPNLPTQLVVRNAGTAESLGVELGGMQYTTYGASFDDVEARETDETRITSNGYIAPAKAMSENAVDPTSEPGVPLISFKRDDTVSAENSARDQAVAVQEVEVRAVSNDIYMYQWDDWNAESNLTGQDFTNPVTPNNAGEESHILTDTQATDYSLGGNVLLRSVRFFEGGTNNKVGDERSERIDARLASGATRVITAVQDGSTAADVDPIIAKIEETY